MKTKIIKLSDIVIDAGTQQREKINEEVVKEYAEAIQCGNKFPPVVAFFDGVNYYLVDGFHRYHAYRISGIAELEADVQDGTKREAILHSASVNNNHGIRLTNSDKRKSVLLLINDSEWSSWSDNKIAKHCKVTQPFVSKVRKEVITVITPSTNNDNQNKVITVISDEPKLASNLDSEDNKESEKPEFSEQELMTEMAEEVNLSDELDAAHKEIDRLNKVIESDDQLSAAMAENKRLEELARVLEERMRGYQSSENEAVRKAKMWKEKYDKLERKFKAAGLVEF